MKVAVVGGGISGLATAFYLKRKGVEVELFEKEKRLGGKMRTVKEKGYIVETGPNGFLDGKPYTLNLVKELGIESELYKSSDKSRKRFIYSGGKLVRLPEDPVSFLLSPLLSPKGKVRLLGEFFVKPKEDESDETLASFVKRRLGKEALDKLLDPMVAGIFAGDPERMSLKAAFPAIYELEKRYGGLIKGLLAKIKESKGKGTSGPSGPGGNLTSFKEGVSQLIEALGKELEGSINLGISPKVERLKSKWLVNSKEFDALVMATPAYAASELLREVNDRLSELLSQIEYSPIAVVGFGFEKEGLGHDLDGFGFLVPKKEGRKILGALWDSSVFPNRAPKGKALIRVMVGGARQPELVNLPPKELVKLALSELIDIMGIRKAPSEVWLFVHRKGIPHYSLGHYKRVQEIFQLGRELGNLYFCNNAYLGVGLNDCVRTAKQVVEKIISQ